MSNLHRQPIYFASDVGQPKAELAAARLRQLNPLISVTAYPFRLNASNAMSLFSQYDLILDCTDNFATKFLINDAAYLTQKSVVRASIYQFEGQIQTYLPKRGDACLRCLWNEVPQEGCVGSCAQVGVIGPLPGYFGVLQAMEAVKFFVGMPVLGSHEILFTDLIYYQQRVISFERRAECPLCGNAPSIVSLADVCEITFQELSAEYEVIDIREEGETEVDPYTYTACTKIPLSRFDFSLLNSSSKYAIVCQSGKRSGRLVELLRKQGITNAVSLVGGQNTAKTL
jgi:molybdopterin/thiamine biosynthesis adenylyltransferase/rhodanese-related sulfurtransferase